jgi:uncharacterized membrane protein YfcA
MGSETDLLLALAIFIGATLYSSVGHGGASAYIALMALFGVPAAVMRPTALVLNLLVSGLGSLRYIRAGQFRWRTLWPFLLGALPMAFIGGGITLAEPHLQAAARRDPVAVGGTTAVAARIEGGAGLARSGDPCGDCGREQGSGCCRG